MTPAPTIRALACPHCGGTVALRAAGATVTLVCEHCGSSLDTTGPDPALIATATEAMRRPPIPLGTRGTLGGMLWEVIGYLERSDGDAGWSEYLLFNPYEGYAFLIDDGRRFSLGRTIVALPDWSWRGMTLADRSYRQFGEPYAVLVTFVVGEFYWRAAVGETVTATDYVTPGHMLTCEENAAERSWTATALLDRGVAEAAFGIEPRGRDHGGTPSPHEPSPYLGRLKEAGIIAAAAFVAMLVITIGGPSAQRAAATRIEIPLDAPARTVVAGPVVIPAGPARVSIRTAAEVENGWVDLDYALVDRATQASYDSFTTAEHYSGVDADGRWEEGDRTRRLDLASVPAGTYDLVVEGEAHRWTGAQGTPPPVPAGTNINVLFGTVATAPVDITVTRGGGFAGNIVLALLAIAIWPVALLCLHLGWEARRMAPVATTDDEGEDD